MPDVWTITLNPTIDANSSVAHVVPERKLRCEPPRYEPGGGGINVSRAMAKLGGDSLAFYFYGGVLGSLLREIVQGEGIQNEPVPVEGLTRQNLIVLESATGLQYRFGMPGPEIQEGECLKLLDRLKQTEPKPQYIVASGSLPPGVPVDFYARMASMARDFGSRMVVDTSGAPLALALEEGVFLIKPNFREMEWLSGGPLENEAQQEAAAERIVKQGGSEVVVVSLGAAGALAVWKEGMERIRAPSVHVKSKVGAGDSMVAGLVLGLVRRLTIPETVRMGVAAGAAAVMMAGTELSHREDTEELYKRISSDALRARSTPN